MPVKQLEPLHTKVYFFLLFAKRNQANFVFQCSSQGCMIFPHILTSLYDSVSAHDLENLCPLHELVSSVDYITSGTGGGGACPGDVAHEVCCE